MATVIRNTKCTYVYPDWACRSDDLVMPLPAWPAEFHLQFSFHLRRPAIATPIPRAASTEFQEFSRLKQRHLQQYYEIRSWELYTLMALSQACLCINKNPTENHASSIQRRDLHNPTTRRFQLPTCNQAWGLIPESRWSTGIGNKAFHRGIGISEAVKSSWKYHLETSLLQQRSRMPGVI